MTLKINLYRALKKLDSIFELVNKYPKRFYGWIFLNPLIKNWFCDDWITKVYYPEFFYPMRNKFIINQGGNPRYNPSGSLYPNDPV